MSLLSLKPKGIPFDAEHLTLHILERPIKLLLALEEGRINRLIRFQLRRNNSTPTNSIQLIFVQKKHRIYRVWLVLDISLYALLAGCAASYQVIDVIDLPPPRHAQAARQDNQITVHWQAGSERRHAQFSGYKLFVANHSLATTPVQELPPPFWLPGTDTTFSFAATDTARLFIHIRSCAGKSKFSLPSLPEVIVPEKRQR